MFYRILFSFVIFYCVQAAVLPVEKCKLSDSACLKSEFQKSVPIFMAGIPELGVEVLDVMNMELIKFDLSGLQFSLTDGKLEGLKSSIIDSVNWDTNNKKFDVTFHLDCKVSGHYTAAGKILILPITGDGELTLKLKNMLLKMSISYELETIDGKDWITPKKLDFEFNVRDNADFYLTDLFNGDKKLSDSMHVFLNENWKDISVEFGQPMVGVAAKSIFKSLKQFFKKMALSDIAEY